LGALCLAAGKKKWRDLKATLVLIDESGFCLVSPLKRSWSPRGQTPQARTSLNHHQRLNLFGALLLSPTLRRIRLSVRSFLCSLCSEHTIEFLKQLLRLKKGRIIIVWDNHKIHLSPKTQAFIEKHPRLQICRFPTCAPELNPVEFVWAQISQYQTGYAPLDMSALCKRIQSGIARTRNSRKRLLACLNASGLSWK
jgi:transposase